MNGYISRFVCLLSLIVLLNACKTGEQALATGYDDGIRFARNILGPKCLEHFEGHLVRAQHQRGMVFAYAQDPGSNAYVCGWSGVTFHNTNVSKHQALTNCEKNREAENFKPPPCRVFSVGPSIVWTDEPSPDEKVTRLPFKGVWDGWKGRPEKLQGWITFAGSRWAGSLKVEATNADVSCKGNWRFKGGKFSGSERPHGVWSVHCSNDKSVTGDYLYEHPEGGFGVGKDEDGFEVTLDFGKAKEAADKSGSANDPNTWRNRAERLLSLSCG